MLEKIMDLARSVSNPYIDEWKARQKPVIGHVCSYIPRELIHAAGALPYRIRAGGNYETGLADELMANITCSFCRSCLELGLKGEYDFLDGIVSMNTCESMRRMCDNWRHKVSSSFYYYMSVPYKSNAAAVQWFVDELKLFTGRLEGFLGVTVTDEEIRKSIKKYDDMRHLLRKLYALRRLRAFPFSGAEIQALTAVLGSIPVEDGVDMLNEAILLAEKEKGKTESVARVMLVGNCLDDINYTEFIQSFGVSVVTDVSCFGMLSLWDDIGVNGDPLETIASSYLRRTVCPRMPQTESARLALIREMVEKYDVDGIIFERMMYCNLWSGETMWLKRDLKELNSPILILDREYTVDSTAQDKTRIEAFLEMIARGRSS